MVHDHIMQSTADCVYAYKMLTGLNIIKCMRNINGT